MRRGLVTIVVLLICGTVPSTARAAGWIGQWRAPQPDSDIHLESALAMAHDPQRQRLYVVDGLAGKLYAFDMQGRKVAEFDGAGDLGLPVSMTVQDSGRFWLVDRQANALVRLVPEQQRLERFGFALSGAQAMLPDKVVWHEKAGLVVLDRLSATVVDLDDDLQVETSYGSDCVDVVGADGGLWILQADARVLRVDPAGGGAGAYVALQYPLQRPVALERTPQGQLLVLDRGLCQVVVFSPEGRYLYSIGARGTRLGRFSAPRQLLLLRSGTQAGALVVLDEINRCADLFRR